MEITGLTRKQQIVLTALMEAVAISDGQVSDGEQQQLGRVAAALGEDNYQDLLDEANNLCPNVDALKEHLLTVHSQEARELIYGTVMEEAMIEPSVAHSKYELMEWLANAWDVKVEISPEDDA